MRARAPTLLDSCEIRTSLSEAEAKQWATIAAAHPRQSLVWVVFFVDGPIGKGAEKTKRGDGGKAADHLYQEDWSYDLIYKLSIMVRVSSRTPAPAPVPAPTPPPPPPLTLTLTLAPTALARCRVRLHCGRRVQPVMPLGLGLGVLLDR